MTAKPTHTYIGNANAERKGQPCRLVNTWRRKGPHNVMVMFADGYEMITAMRCLRKAKEAK